MNRRVFALLILWNFCSVASADLKLGDVIHQLRTDNPCWSLTPEDYKEIEKTYICNGLSKNGLFDIHNDSRDVLKKMVFNLAAKSQEEWLGCYKEHLRNFGSSELRKKWISSSEFLLENYFRQRQRAAKLRAYERLKQKVITQDLYVNTGGAEQRKARADKALQLADGKHDYAAEAALADERAETYLELLGFLDFRSMKKTFVVLIDEAAGAGGENIKDPKESAKAIVEAMDAKLVALMESGVEEVEEQRQRIISARVETRDGTYYNMNDDWKRELYARGHAGDIVTSHYPSVKDQDNPAQSKLLNCFAGDYGSTTATVQTASTVAEVLLLGMAGVGRLGSREMVQMVIKGVNVKSRLSAFGDAAGLALMYKLMAPEVVKVCMKLRLEVVAASKEVCNDSGDQASKFMSKWMDYHSCLGEVLLSLSPI